MRVLHWLVMVTGALVGASGLVLVALYFYEGVYVRMGEADQSLMFWYLPLLLFGAIALSAGTAMVMFARQKLAECGNQDDD